MARGEKSNATSARKDTARKTQAKLQDNGLSKRAAERRAWDDVTSSRSARSAGTSGGKSEVSKRTAPAKGSTRKTKNTGKTRN
jgi:hypothetical protein